jgi:hypothetical protein
LQALGGATHNARPPAQPACCRPVGKKPASREKSSGMTAASLIWIKHKSRSAGKCPAAGHFCLGRCRLPSSGGGSCGLSADRWVVPPGSDRL